MEPMNMTAGNEDGNCYSFDGRKLDEAKCVNKDHVGPMLSIDFSPTGREFVTGFLIDLWESSNGGHSREIYHTKRMQRVFCIKHSCDATYVISGSDDTNVRLWKAKASEQLGVILPREQMKLEGRDAVMKRYKHLPEIKRIVRHRHVSKPIYKVRQEKRDKNDSERRKEAKRKAHSAPGTYVTQPLRK